MIYKNSFFAIFQAAHSEEIESLRASYQNELEDLRLQLQNEQERRKKLSSDLQNMKVKEIFRE